MHSQLIGKRIARRYTLRSLIGRGGMGAVYLADDQKLSRRVALKIIRPEFSTDPKTRRRFNKEARAFAYLKHPHIVEVFDFGQDPKDGTLYLSMELIRGHSLRVLRHVDLPLWGVIEIIDQLLGALAHAHARGVIHRDLKPENVLVIQRDGSTNPVVKLVDFGLASLPKASDTMMSQTGSVIGTPSYMAPEQARGARGVVGPSTDIYAVGVILYEMLCDRLPFEAESGIELILKHVQQPVPALRPRAGLAVSPKMQGIIERAMAKKPWDRFVNAADFRKALKAIEVPFEEMPLIALPDDDNWEGDVVELPEAQETSPPGTRNESLSGMPQTPGEDFKTSRSSGVFSPINAATPLPAKRTGGRESSASRWRALSSRESESGAPRVITPPAARTVMMTPTPTSNSSISSMSGPLGPSEFVGRESERARLEKICQSALDGHGQIVFIDGEQGIGKSRTARMLMHRFTETGRMRGAVGLYTPTEGGGPTIGLRGAIEGLFNTTDLDRAGMEAQTRGVLARLGIHDERDQQELTDYLRPVNEEFESSNALLVDEGLRRRQSHLALLQRLVRLVAAEVPLILLLEDFHWSNDGATGFIEAMANSFRMQRSPCLIICSMISDELDTSSATAEGLSRLARFEGSIIHRVRLDRLSRAEVIQLLNQTLPLEASLAEQLAERAGGNPLYALQLLQSLQQDRQLSRNDRRRWMIRGDQSIDNVLPNSIAEVLRRRIQRTRARFDAHGPRDYEVLIRIAVLGAVCDVQLLEAYLQREDDSTLLGRLDEALDAWLESGILREVSDRRGDLIEFDHALMREVLLEDVAKRKLRKLHLRAAQVKRDHFYPALAPVARDIGEHFLLAGEAGLASEYHLLAARSAEAAGDFRQALELYESLRALYEQVEGGSGEGPARLSSARRHQQSISSSGLNKIQLDWSEVWLGLGRIAIAQGDYVRAEPHVAQLMRYAEARDLLLPQAKANWLMGRIATRRGELVDAWEYYNQARDLYEVEADMVGVAQCLWGSGEVARLSGWLDDARRYISDALELHQGHNRPVDVAACQLALGWTAMSGGLLIEANGHYSQAQETFAGAEDRYHVNYCQLGQANVARQMGQVREALETLRALEMAFEVIGDRHGQAQCLQTIGQCHMQLRQIDEAERFFERALESYHQLTDRKGASQILLHRATTLRWRGAGAQAIQCLGQATEYFTEVDDRQGLAACYLERAWIALDFGDLGRADEHLEASHSLYELSNDAIGVACCAEISAYIEHQRGEFQKTLEYAREGFDVAQQTGAQPLQARLTLIACMACAAAGQLGYLRSMSAPLEHLGVELETIGDPIFARALSFTVEKLRAGLVEPDLRGLQRRFEALVAYFEARPL